MNVPDALAHALRDQKELERQYTLGFAPAVASTGPYDAGTSVAGVDVEVRADDSGRYGLRLRRIHLEAAPAADAGDAHAAVLAALTGKVTTPYGPFHVESRDGVGLESVARTHRVGDAGSYYQAVVRDGCDVTVTHHAGSDERETPVDIGMDMFRIMLSDLIDALRPLGSA